MGVIARVVGVAACGLSLAVLAAAPTAGADPTGALPPMTSSGSGPVIGDGDAALRQRISQQLFSFGDPTVRLGRGSIHHGRSRCRGPRCGVGVLAAAAGVGLPTEHSRLGGRLRGARLPANRRAMGRRDAGRRQEHRFRRRRPQGLRQVRLAQGHGGHADFDVQQRLDLPAVRRHPPRRRGLFRLAGRHGLGLLQCAQRELPNHRELMAGLAGRRTVGVRWWAPMARQAGRRTPHTMPKQELIPIAVARPPCARNISGRGSPRVSRLPASTVDQYRYRHALGYFR